jgi:hypothetical protein
LASGKGHRDAGHKNGLPAGKWGLFFGGHNDGFLAELLLIWRNWGLRFSYEMFFN